MKKLVVLAVIMLILPSVSFACDEGFDHDTLAVCGGGSAVQLAPQIRPESVQLSISIENGHRVVRFLGSHFGFGGVLLNRTATSITLDDLSRPVPVGAFMYDVQNEVRETYHTVILPNNIPSGDYYLRPYFLDKPCDVGQCPITKVHGQEVLVHIP